MKLKLNYCAWLFVVLLCMLSCKKEEKNEPLTDDPTVPAQVSNIKVVNGHGKATLTYTVPKDPNLLYVKAVYTISSGIQYETKASSFNNVLIVDGFADTTVHEVKLYSVSRSDVVSQPLTISIKPLLAPIWEVYKSIQVKEAFGGYNLTATNLNKDNIAIIVTKKNVFNEYEADNNKSIYTKTDSILSRVRGLDTVTYRYGFFVKDRWGNKTDTIYKDVKSLYEAELPGNTFSEFNLPGDAPQWNNGETAVRYLWDKRTGWPWTSFTSQIPGGTKPHMITINTGVLSRVSRIWIRPYPEGTRYFYLTTMKRFEIYGSANPSLNGALDSSWYLLGSYIVKKPSGLPYGNDDANDQAVAAAGFSWEADLRAPKVKYIRIRCLENFGGGTAQSINELKVYGDLR